MLGFSFSLLCREGSETEEPTSKEGRNKEGRKALAGRKAGRRGGSKEGRQVGRQEGRKKGRKEGRRERGWSGKRGNSLEIAWGPLEGARQKHRTSVDGL